MVDDPQVNDAALITAIRKRLLDEIGRKEAAGHIVNNVYGGGGGVSDHLGHAGHSGDINPDDSDYFVDILRKNYDPGDEADVLNPDTGKREKKRLERGGWGKSVHRFSSKKKVK